MDSIYGFLHQYICFVLFCFFPNKIFFFGELYFFNESHPVASAIFFFLFKWFVMVLLSFFFRLFRLPNLLLTLISLHVVGRHGNTTRRLVAVSFLCKLRKYRNYTETANNNCQGIISLSFYEKVDFSTVKYSFPLFMIKRLSACRLNFQCILSSF